MENKVSKVEEMLKLSDEILYNLENHDVSLEKTVLKCKRLARLRDDFEALNWFAIELHGYDQNNLPVDVTIQEAEQFAKLSGRYFLVDGKNMYHINSIPVLESNIYSFTVALENIKPPSQYEPAVSRHSHDNTMFGKGSNQYVLETYRDVLDKVNGMNAEYMKVINSAKSVLSKIRNNIYNYILNINLQLKFENITESIFQKTKENVDKKLTKICPLSMKKFVAAYQRLESNNVEEWSQALSSCRNILKDFADFVFQPDASSYKLKDGREISVTDDKYKNRLLAFIDRECQGNRRRLLMFRTADLEARIHGLNDILSEGTHGGVDSLDVNICVIDMYLLIGSLLSLTSAGAKEP